MSQAVPVVTPPNALSTPNIISTVADFFIARERLRNEREIARMEQQNPTNPNNPQPGTVTGSNNTPLIIGGVVLAAAVIVAVVMVSRKRK